MLLQPCLPRNEVAAVLLPPRVEIPRKRRNGPNYLLPQKQFPLLNHIVSPEPSQKRVEQPGYPSCLPAKETKSVCFGFLDGN